MTRQLIAILVLLTGNTVILAQKCPLPVSIDKYGFLQEVESGPDSSRVKINRNRYVWLSATDCIGSICLREFDMNNRLLFEGAYVGIDSIHTSSISYIVNGETMRDSIANIQYYEPMRNGCWRYYDTLGVVIKTEWYNKGKLVGIGLCH